MKLNPTLKEKLQLEKVYTLFKRILPSLKWVLIISLSIVIGGYINSFSYNRNSNNEAQDSSATDSSNTKDDNCNVAGINLHGSLETYTPNHADNDSLFNYDRTSSESVTGEIITANNDPKIKAILIEVDSGGGSPVAGEEIADAVKASSKPVVAFIRDSGASAAYWAISSADRIFASKNSNVGSIGVTQSYLNDVEKNKKEGYTYEQLSSGKYKDTGSPDKVLTSEEKSLLLRDINIIYENFVATVAQNRGLTVKAVKGFADGSTVLGEKAKSLGLIDEIGGRSEAEKYISGKIGERADTCWQ